MEEFGNGCYCDLKEHVNEGVTLRKMTMYLTIMPVKNSPLYKSTIHDSFSARIRNVEAGLGNGTFRFSALGCSASSSGCSCFANLRCWIQLITDRFTPVGGIDPFPTTFLHVSGKKNTNSTRSTPEKIARNQKIDRHPRYCASSPPIVGPKAGPMRMPAPA